jgi:hypothetical protein
MVKSRSGTGCLFLIVFKAAVCSPIKSEKASFFVANGTHLPSSLRLCIQSRQHRLHSRSVVQGLVKCVGVDQAGKFKSCS